MRMYFECWVILSMKIRQKLGNIRRRNPKQHFSLSEKVYIFGEHLLNSTAVASTVRLAC